MHIKYIRLNNFKSHKDTLIEFDEITSIVGTNAQGKTNLITALKVLTQHATWPEKFIRWGQKEAFIEVGMVDGTIIRRKRTLKGQTVSIEEPNQPVRVYDGVKDCESFVRKISGFNTISLIPGETDEDLNFIDAHAPLRIIFDPPGKVQKQISSLIGSAPIENAKGILASKLRKNESTIELYNTDLLSVQDKLKANNAKLVKLENLLSLVNELDTTIQESSKLKRSLEDFEISVLEIESYSIHDSLVPDWVNRVNKLDIVELDKQFTKLQNLRQLSVDVENNPLFDSTLLKTLLAKVENIYEMIEIYYSEYSSLVELISSYISEWSILQSLQTDIDKLLDEETTQKNVLDSLMLGINICPVCNQPMNV